MKTFVIALGLALITATSAKAVTVANAVQIEKPDRIRNNGVGSNDSILWFQEAAGVVARADVAGRGGTGIQAGVAYDSFMVFLNRESGRTRTTKSASFLFDSDIVAVFGNKNGRDLRQTNYVNPETNYRIRNGFGIENGNSGALSGRQDSISFTDNALDVTFRVRGGGDWIRVMTVAVVPLPASGAMLPLALLGLGAIWRTRRKA